MDNDNIKSNELLAQQIVRELIDIQQYYGLARERLNILSQQVVNSSIQSGAQLASVDAGAEAFSSSTLSDKTVSLPLTSPKEGFPSSAVSPNSQAESAVAKQVASISASAATKAIKPSVSS